MERWDDSTGHDNSMVVTLQQSYHDMAQSLVRVTSSLASSSPTAMFMENPLSLVSALEHTASVMTDLARSIQYSHGISPSPSSSRTPPPLHQSDPDSTMTTLNFDSYSTFDDSSFMVPDASSPLSPPELEHPMDVNEYDEMMLIIPVKDEDRPVPIFPSDDEPSSIVGLEFGLGSSSEIDRVVIPKTSSNPGTPITTKKRARYTRRCRTKLNVSAKTKKKILENPAAKETFSRRLGPTSIKPDPSLTVPSVRKSNRERYISKRASDSVMTHVQDRPISKKKSMTAGSQPNMKSYGIIGPTGRLMTLDYWATIVPTDWETLTKGHKS